MTSYCFPLHNSTFRALFFERITKVNTVAVVFSVLERPWYTDTVKGENLGFKRGLPRPILRQVVPLQRTTKPRDQCRHRQGGSGRSFLGSP